MRKMYFLAVFAALALLNLAACSSKSTAGVVLEQTPVISGGLGWGVVSLSYTKLLLEPSSIAAASGSARRNEVGKIVARSRVFESRDAGVWYKIEMESIGGWLHESALNVYRSEAEARKAAESGS